MPLTIRTFTEKEPQLRTASVRINLMGSLDSATSPELEVEVDKIVKEKPRLLVFDLSSLKYISSAGIRILVKARKCTDEYGGLCVVTKPQPQIEKVLEIIKSLPGFSIFKDDAEMDAYLAEIQSKVLSGKLSGKE